MKKLLILLLLLGIVSLYALESDPSDTVGFVKYSCVTTSTTNLNFIAMSMEAGYANASDLGAAYSNVNAVSKWDASTQSWTQASAGPFGWANDFALQDGYAYMIGVTANTDVFIAGGMITQPQYNMVTTSTTNLNAIMLPMNRSDLANASDLGGDIGSCDAVSKWEASSQSWTQASAGPFGWANDFAISIGNPYMVGVTANVTWPTTAKNLKTFKHQNLR